MENKTILDFHKLNLTDDNLFELCNSNSSYKIERDSNQNLIVMEPSGFESDNFAFEIASEIRTWDKQQSVHGKVVASSAGFILPSKAMRSPDAAWVSGKILAEIPKELQKKFLPACPEFVVEVKSPTDSLNELKAKMNEWIDNGCLLAWLVNPEDETTWVYKKNELPVIFRFDELLDGRNVLVGFKLRLSDLLRSR